MQNLTVFLAPDGNFFSYAPLLGWTITKSFLILKAVYILGITFSWSYFSNVLLDTVIKWDLPMVCAFHGFFFLSLITKLYCLHFFKIHLFTWEKACTLLWVGEGAEPKEEHQADFVLISEPDAGSIYSPGTTACMETKCLMPDRLCHPGAPLPQFFFLK